MKYECIWNAYPCWIIYLAQSSKCFLLKQSSELASLVHSSTSLVSPAHHSHLQREIGVSLLQWQELSLASGLALGIISHRIPMDSRKRLRAGKCPHCCCYGALAFVLMRRVEAFICGSCAGVLWESEPHAYLGFRPQPRVVSSASIQCSLMSKCYKL